MGRGKPEVEGLEVKVEWQTAYRPHIEVVGLEVVRLEVVKLEVVSEKSIMHFLNKSKPLPPQEGNEGREEGRIKDNGRR